MRKLLIFVIFFLFSFTLSADWTISTSRGDKILVVPEGLTLEEAYCQMAQLYWEERYDREELQATVKDLTEKTEEYIAINESLVKSQATLIQNYKDLSHLYEEKLKSPWMKGLLSVDIGFPLLEDRINGTIYGGVLIKERITLEAGLGFPWEVHIKAGVLI